MTINSHYYIAFITILCFLGTPALEIKDFLGDGQLTARDAVEDIIEYFKAENPHGIPILNVPETITHAGPTELSSRMTLKDVFVTGLSQISLDYVDINLEILQLQLKLKIPELEVLAEYELSMFYSNSAGDMNVTFVDLQVGLKCDLEVNSQGIIRIRHIEPTLEKEKFITKFTGLSGPHSLTMTAGDYVFDTLIIPLLRSRANGDVKTKLNLLLKEKLKKKFPLDIAPIDFAISYGKKIAAKRLPSGISPIIIKKEHVVLEGSYFNYLMTLKATNITIEGLDSLHRTGAIRAELVDNKIYVTVEIGTQNLKASTHWSLEAPLFTLYSGHADFLIESFQISVTVEQKTNIIHPAVLRCLDMKLGNIALRSSGESSLEYVLEGAVNILPNILRNVILDKTVEGKVKQRVQMIFNKIKWEDEIGKHINKLEDMVIIK